MEHLKPAQIEELRKVFLMFAKPARNDSSGVPMLNARDLYAILTACAIPALTEGEVSDMVTVADTTGRGLLDFDDFAHLMTLSMRDVDVNLEQTAAFETVDGDHDGYISTTDLQTFVEQCTRSGAGEDVINSALRDSLSQVDLEAIVKEASEKRDKGISPADFAQLIASQVAAAGAPRPQPPPTVVPVLAPVPEANAEAPSPVADKATTRATGKTPASPAKVGKK
jgi:Ca2+-binding EF-hand superfamily protein